MLNNMKKNYYKIFSVTLVIPTSGGESVNEKVDNNNLDVVKQQFVKINEDIQEIMDGVLLKKGYIDAKDVDGLKKIFNYKMEKAGIDLDRYFINMTIVKEKKIENLSDEEKLRLSEKLFKQTGDILQRISNTYGEDRLKVIEEHIKVVENANKRFHALGLNKEIRLNHFIKSNSTSDSITNSNISNNNIANNNKSVNSIEESLNFITSQKDKYFTFNFNDLSYVELLEINNSFLFIISLFCLGIIMVFYLMKTKVYI